MLIHLMNRQGVPIARSVQNSGAIAVVIQFKSNRTRIIGVTHLDIYRSWHGRSANIQNYNGSNNSGAANPGDTTIDRVLAY